MAYYNRTSYPSLIRLLVGSILYHKQTLLLVVTDVIYLILTSSLNHNFKLRLC
jgi:hypothetical protein